VLCCRAVIRLLARLAAFAPERFAQDYLVKCILHLLAVLKHTSEHLGCTPMACLAAACLSCLCLVMASDVCWPLCMLAFMH
jgi:hypothetical protein